MHKWNFTKYFRSGVYSWKGSALASSRIKEAIKEILAVAKNDPALAAEGAVVFIEKCWRALEHIDSSSGAIGNAVNKALFELAEVVARAEIPSKERLKLTTRIWDSWQDEGYGYYDMLSELWPKYCVEKEVMNYWADSFLPVVKDVFKSTTPGAYFKGSEPCLACLFEAGRHDEIVGIFKTGGKSMLYYQKYLIKVEAARGDIDKALLMVDECRKDSYSSFEARQIGEELLINAGRIEEAYQRFGLNRAFEATGLTTLSAIRKRYPTISPERILNDLINADIGNERRYFAAARKIGMIDLAIELAEKYDVEPKTLITACKDYLEKDVHLSLKFGLLALQKYADGSGYEPEYSDIKKCYEFVCEASERAGKQDDVSKQIELMVQHDKSGRKLVTEVVKSQNVKHDNILHFRTRGKL